MTEYWDELDENRQMTGKRLVRGEMIPEGSFHAIVHLCLFNSAGKLLSQKRQSWKTFSNMWDFTVGGAVEAGESPQQAMTRELSEELGAGYDFTDSRPVFTIKGINFFDDYFFLFADVDKDRLQLQPEEVQDVNWYSYEEILALVSRGEFIPWKILDYVFALKQAIMNDPEFMIEYRMFVTDNGIDNDLMYRFHPEEYEDKAV